jgi:uncharacterized secreted protein with C-terminal beta-propeller domain
MKQIAILAATFALVIALLFSGCTGTQVNPPITPPADSAGMKSFGSWGEVSSFLSSASMGGYGGYYGGRGILMATGAPQAAMAEDASKSASDYSTTNIQVEGVDEADIIKNDGKYIYLVSGPNYYYGGEQKGKVLILNAFPPSEMGKISEIEFDGTASELFIYKDKLVVFGNEYRKEEMPPEPPSADAKIAAPGIMPPYPYYSQNYAFMKIYDISDRASPKLEKEISSRGSYVQSRMISGKVYSVFQDTPYYPRPMPLYEVDGVKREIAPTDIRYFDIPDENYNYNIFTSINLDDLSKEETRKIVLMGYSQTLYVSQENMYMTYTKYSYPILWPAYEKVYGPLLPLDVKNEISKIDSQNISDWRKDRLKTAQVMAYLYNYSASESLDTPVSADVPTANSERTRLNDEFAKEAQKIYEEHSKQREQTVINKIALNGFAYVGKAEVPGHVLNQFSMDEHKGNLRIATTVGELFGGWWGGRVLQGEETPHATNSVYVLDSSLNIVGRLEGLAPNEKIYSARFMGDRAYLVTFKKVDPFFVLDLSEPTNPRVLGKLKIPGYSDYLHPYDENHVIGLGKGAVAAEEGDFAWYQGVKLSLFDVSDLSNPKEVAKYEIGDRGTDSNALYDHKAFLFSKERNLLVIPIQLAEIDEGKYPAGVEPNTYGDFVFQGAYVFSITPEDGFGLKGRITHATSEDAARSGEYYWSNAQVKRSLYMDNYLYTISDRFVKANDLGTLDEIARLQISEASPEPKYY